MVSFVEQDDLEEYCYVTHIATNYDGVDGPTRGAKRLKRMEEWLRQVDFLEFFTDPIHIELESDKVWPTQRFEQVTGYLDDVNDDLTSKNPLPPGNEIGPEDIKN